MKYLVLLAMITFAKSAAAQLRQVVTKDSETQKAAIKNTTLKRKAVFPITLKAEIENELNRIVDAHKHEPNTAATWVKIKADAENLLYSYFQKGKLRGNKSLEAYYVKIGNDTMTAADIRNHTFILLAGVATVKPAEFEIIRIEKTATH